MSDNTSGKMSLLTVGGIGIVGTLLGTIATFILTHQAVQPDHRFTGQATTIHARVTLNNDGTCTQRVSGVRFAFPVLSSGRSIDWQGQDGRSGHGGVFTSIIVQFDPQVTPFSENQFVSNTVGPTPPSGTAIKGADDYSYQSVTVAGVPCTLSDPGVHVDQ